jgi:hypothetical protein
MSVPNHHDNTWESDAIHLYQEIPPSDLKKEIFLAEAQKQHNLSEKEAQNWFTYAWQNYENRIVDFYDPTGDRQNPVDVAMTLSDSMQKTTNVILSKLPQIDVNMQIDDQVILVNTLSELKEYLKEMKKIMRTLFDFGKEKFYQHDEVDDNASPKSNLQAARKIINQFQDWSQHIYENMGDINMPSEDYDKDVTDVYQLYAAVGEFKGAVKHAKKLVQTVFSL